MEKVHIHHVYLYLFALVGLILTTIGGVSLIELGLKVFVFTAADMDYYSFPVMAPLEPKLAMYSDNSNLTDAERAQVRQLLVDYSFWKERFSAVNPIAAQRQRELASALAMLLVGLPIYLYHWKLIRKENKH